MSVITYIKIKTGLQDYFSAFSATVLPMRSSITRLTTNKGGAYYHIQEDFEIVISAKRLARDNPDLQLGNAEREIQRLIHQYRPQDITLIESMSYGGQERMYDSENWARSNWMTKIFLRITYHDVQ